MCERGKQRKGLTRFKRRGERSEPHKWCIFDKSYYLGGCIERELSSLVFSSLLAVGRLCDALQFLPLLAVPTFAPYARRSLAGLGELSLLDLSFTPVSDINCLAQLQKLEVLRLGFCQVQEEGWDVVSKMTGLKTLQCGQLCSTMPKVMNKIREGGVTVTF